MMIFPKADTGVCSIKTVFCEVFSNTEILLVLLE